MRQIIFVGVTVLSLGCLGGCGAGIKEKGQEMAAHELVDPTSAQFRNVIKRGSNVCGQVNSKDIVGNYLGYKGFIAKTASSAVIIEPDSKPDPALGELDWLVNQVHKNVELIHFEATSVSLCGVNVGSDAIATAEESVQQMNDTIYTDMKALNLQKLGVDGGPAEVAPR